MKIYTKTGDKGATGLFGGARVSKSSLRVQAYGEVDELNAAIGLVCAETEHMPIQQSLLEVQNTLFVLGAQLASPGQKSARRVGPEQIESLERQMDAITETLPALTNFILPGGCKTAALLHLARTICRRAERQVVALSEVKGEGVESGVIIYLNRLSDFLFTLARLANQLENIADVPWK